MQVIWALPTTSTQPSRRELHQGRVSKDALERALQGSSLAVSSQSIQHFCGSGGLPLRLEMKHASRCALMPQKAICVPLKPSGLSDAFATAES